MRIVPKPYPKEFRDDVVNVARSRKPRQSIKQIVADSGIASPVCATGYNEPMSRGRAQARNHRSGQRLLR